MSIVEELRKDPESGARRLEGEYKAGLMTLARRFSPDEGDAEELVNRTFAAVVAGIDDYVEQSAFFAWMCQILSHLHSMDQRRKSRRNEVAAPDAGEAPDEGVAERVFESVDAALLRESIDALPKDMKQVLVMHYLMDLPLARIGKFLALPVGTVKWRLHCARSELWRRLGTQRPGVRMLVLALLLAAGLAIGGGLYALGAALFGSQDWTGAAHQARKVSAKWRNSEGSGSIRSERKEPPGCHLGRTALERAPRVMSAVSRPFSKKRNRRKSVKTILSSAARYRSNCSRLAPWPTRSSSKGTFVSMKPTGTPSFVRMMSGAPHSIRFGSFVATRSGARASISALMAGRYECSVAFPVA